MGRRAFALGARLRGHENRYTPLVLTVARAQSTLQFWFLALVPKARGATSTSGLVVTTSL
jgi:hypothetical protein